MTVDGRAKRGQWIFRGRVLGARQFAQIRLIIENRAGQTRQDVARATSRYFGWRCRSGVCAVRATRELLVRLDRAGLIDLPAAIRSQGRPRREAQDFATRLLPAPQDGTWKPRSANAPFVVRPIEAGELFSWRAQMERYHYLGDAPIVGECLRYFAFHGGELVALLGWGSASLHNAPRDRHIGWDSVAKRAHLHEVVNNVRFLILPWLRQPHLASRVLGANLRRLSNDWDTRYGHPVVLAETFVDISRFRGTCYRASNWLCVGETKGWSKSGTTYHFNGQPKSVWLYPLTRNNREYLRTTRVPTRRKGRMTIIDVEKLPLDGEGGLFEVLKTIPDPRKARGIRHGIQSVLAITVCGAMTGAKSFIALGEWAAEQSPETLKRLGSKRGRPPSERTIRRVLHAVDVKEVDHRTSAWVANQTQLAGRAISVDGKTVRGSRDGERKAIHLLSAVVHESSTVVAQVAVGEKTNEITHVKPLLANLNIEGAVVTADALLTQHKIADFIVKEKHADYVFTVKDNQPTMRQDIEALHLDAFPPGVHDDR